MDSTLTELWVYLAREPLLHLTLTLLAYLCGVKLHQWSGQSALANPVVIAIALLVGLLIMTETPYARYFEGAQFIHFLLGPATVALAVPLYQHFGRIRAQLVPIIAGLLAGSLTAIVSATGLVWLLSGSRETLVSMAPKSATTPVAMGIAEQLGGLPALTAVLVIMTGIIGAVTGPLLLRWLRIDDEAARGLALGVASHGIGTARAFQSSDLAGAFSGLGMGLNALLTALLVPLIVQLI